MNTSFCRPITTSFLSNYLGPVADLGGGAPGARPPPTVQNFLDFMQFFGKFDKIVCWRPPPLEGWRPLLQGILDPPLRTHGYLTCRILSMRKSLQNCTIQEKKNIAIFYHHGCVWPLQNTQSFYATPVTVRLAVTNWFLPDTCNRVKVDEASFDHHINCIITHGFTVVVHWHHGRVYVK